MNRKFSAEARGFCTRLNRLFRGKLRRSDLSGGRRGISVFFFGKRWRYRLPPALALLCLCCAYGFLRFSPYEDLEAFRRRPVSTRYYDRNGRLLQIVPLEGGLRREYRALKDIPGELAAVFVFAEDARFYGHPGVDFPAIFRALIQNLRTGRRVSGASTITMQLARLIALRGNKEDTNYATASGGLPALLGRKIAEAANAFRLEARLSKGEILELYLNSVPFGFQTEGIASAARNFFAAEPLMLSPAQIFCLAVIPRRPAAYNPVSEGEACVRAAKQLQLRFAAARRAFSLLAQVEEADWRFALSRAGRFAYPQEMPHLVRHMGARLAAGERGKTEFFGEIHLAADLALQRRLEEVLAANISRYRASRLSNGAAIVIDNETAEILAWVGSADYGNESAAGQIDGVIAANQPGSSMKPFLYALALERGFKPTDVLADIPMNFGVEELYIPQNFNNRFNGPIRFRPALASSLNIPAVHILYRLGVRSYIDFLVSLGFDSLAESGKEAGLGLALGNSPVSIADLVRAFSVFPRDGLLLPLAFEKTEAGAPPVRVMAPDTARLICSFLSDRSARVLAFGAGRNFITPFPVIFKTGTANQYQSIVALGATPRYSAAVWMGNFTGETVIGRTGSSVPAALVREALVFLQGSAGPSFREPEHFVERPVCALSGMAPTEYCLSTIGEYVEEGTELEPCTWHRGSTVVYPAEYQSWFFSLPRQGGLDYAGSPLQVVTPREGFVFFAGGPSGNDRIPVEVTGGGQDELTAEYDGTEFTVSRPFIFYLPHEPGSHILTVRSGGESQSVHFSVR
jgi:penicillin-binding protein 1C